MRLTKRELMADGILLLTAVIWGSAFAIVKNSLDAFAPAMLITLRYVIATPLSALAFRKHLRGLTRGDVLRGALVGVILGVAYILQTVGLVTTTAGKNAFLTGVYVLLVPFIGLVFFRQKLRPLLQK
jgi:drug/metabolite transporter (DMT)-like permease